MDRVTGDRNPGIDVLVLSSQVVDVVAAHRSLRSLGLAIFVPLLVPACGGPLSIVDPASAAAERIAALWWIMLVGAVVILCGIMALFLMTFRKGGTERKVPSNAFLVGGGLVFPLATLAGLLVYALAFGQWLLPRPYEDVLRIEARGYQWRWEFTHYDANGAAVKVGNELHLPARQPVEVTVVSADVIHSFWIPRLAGKIDAVPGLTNVVRIDSAQPGVYEGVCAEFCGLGHAHMRFRTIVHPPGRYADALAAAAETMP